MTIESDIVDERSDGEAQSVTRGIVKEEASKS
jgi:hypothetical protein